MIEVLERELALVALQVDGVDVDVTIGEGLVGSAVSTFFLTLITGAILVAVFPASVERLMADVTEDPLGSVFYGFAAFLVIGILLVALVVSLVGIPIALGLVAGAYLVWTVGAAIAFLAIAVRLVDQEDGWLPPLLVAAGMNGGLALTGVGWLLAVVVGFAGFGVVLRDKLG